MWTRTILGNPNRQLTRVVAMVHFTFYWRTVRCVWLNLIADVLEARSTKHRYWQHGCLALWRRAHGFFNRQGEKKFKLFLGIELEVRDKWLTHFFKPERLRLMFRTVTHLSMLSRRRGRPEDLTSLHFSVQMPNPTAAIIVQKSKKSLSSPPPLPPSSAEKDI